MLEKFMDSYIAVWTTCFLTLLALLFISYTISKYVGVAIVAIGGVCISYAVSNVICDWLFADHDDEDFC